MFAQVPKPPSIPKVYPRSETLTRSRPSNAPVLGPTPTHARGLRWRAAAEENATELEPHWAAVIDVATD
jgi:hypothetical protein